MNGPDPVPFEHKNEVSWLPIGSCPHSFNFDLLAEVLFAMLFRDVVFLSALVASVSAVAVHPLLISRQNLGSCQTQCALIVQKEPQIQSGVCDLSCICTNTFVNAVSSCINCLQETGQSLQGVPSNFAQQLESECASAGYPVNGGSGGSGGSTVTGSSSDSTSLGGGLGGSTVTGTASSSKSTGSSSSGSGSSSSGGGGGGLAVGGKNGAAGLSANLSGVLAVAVAVGLVVMSA